MKKSILTTAFALTVLFASAQLYVTTTNNVGIGTSTPYSLLSAGGNGNLQYTMYGYSPNLYSGYNSGVRGEIATSSNGAMFASGVYGFAAPGGDYSYGLTGSSYTATVTSNGQAWGVYGVAGNATSGYNYGVYGYLAGSNNGGAVVGSTSGSNVNISTGKYAGYFVGLIRTTNDLPEKPTSGSWTGYSDSRLKKDIVPFTDGLQVLRKVNPISYKFNGIGDLPTAKTNIGVLAQDIQKVAPYCVSTGKLLIDHADAQNFSSDIISSMPADSSGKAHDIVQALTYNQDGLIYVLINSVKQLDSTVTALQTQLNASKSQRTNGSGGGDEGNKAATIHDMELASGTAIIYQNAPNPFGDGTTIKYFIPDNVQSALVVFFDSFGNQIKEFKVEEKGMGQLNVSTLNLATGVYSYSLLVNGKAIDTKKMLKSN